MQTITSLRFYKALGVVLAVSGFLLILHYQKTVEKNFESTSRLSSSAIDDKNSSQKLTKEQLDRFYEAVGSTFQPPSKWKKVSNYQTYYFPQINVIYTGIPKTGCSHWKELFLRAEGVLQGPLENLPDVHKKFGLPYRLPLFSKVLDGEYDEKLKTATSIVALRNPWVRAVSGYRQKLSSEMTLGNILPQLRLEILRSERGMGTVA